MVVESSKSFLTLFLGTFTQYLVIIFGMGDDFLALYVCSQSIGVTSSFRNCLLGVESLLGGVQGGGMGLLFDLLHGKSG